ncbi:tetratricopeptide repeat protein [Azospirillum melinis]
MSITHHLLHILLQEHRHRPIRGEFLFIGRQSILLSPEAAIAVLRRSGVEPRAGVGAALDRATALGRANGGIADYALLGLFCDAHPQTLDIVDDEGAEIVHDLNTEIGPELCGRFDFILNGSCLDNIFDPVRVIDNLSRMLKPGGRILHWESGSMNPHQPYLMFSVNWFHDYYVANGFRDVQAYLARCDDLFADWDMLHWSPLDPALHRLGLARPTEGALDLPGTLLACVLAEAGAEAGAGRRPIQVIYRPDAVAEEMVERLQALDQTRPVFNFPAPHGIAPARHAALLRNGFEPVGRIPGIAGWLDADGAVDRLSARYDRFRRHVCRLPAAGGRLHPFVPAAGYRPEILADIAHLGGACRERPVAETARWSGIGHALLGEIGQALAHLDRAVASDPDPLLGCDRALLHLLAGNRAEAEADVAAALEALPEDADVRRLAGWIRFAAGRFAEAAEHLELALSQRPDGGVLRDLALVWQAMGDHAQAGKLLERAAGAVPEDGEILNLLAETQALAGRDEAAVETLRRACAQPGAGMAAAHYLLGVVLSRLGRWEEAIAAYRRCLDLHGTFLARIGLRQALERLGGHEAASRLQTGTAALSRRDYLAERIGEAGRKAAMDEIDVRYLTPLPFEAFCAEAGLPLNRKEPSRKEPNWKESGGGAEERGLRLAGPGEVTVWLSRDGAVSPPLSDRHYATDGWFSQPRFLENGRRLVHPRVLRDVRDHCDWLADLSGLPTIVIDEPCLLLGGTGAGQFLGDILPKLFTAEWFDIPRDLPVYSGAANRLDLAIAGLLFPERRLIPLASFTGPALLRFRHAYVPATPPGTLTVAAYRQRLGEVGLKGSVGELDGAGTESRIFLEDPEAPPFRIADPDAVGAVLARHGVAVMPVTSCPPHRLLASLATAGTVVLPAGMRSILTPFCAPTAAVLELLPATRLSEEAVRLHASLGRAAVRRYEAVAGRVEAMVTDRGAPTPLVRFEAEMLDQALRRSLAAVRRPGGAGVIPGAESF